MVDTSYFNYAVTQWPGPPVLYNFTAARSCTLSGAFAGETPLYWLGATESQVDCKNWYLPAAPEDGFIAWISPPDSRWAICCKCEFTFTDEPLEALLEEVWLVDVDFVCGCAVCSFCGADTCTGCCCVATWDWLGWTGCVALFVDS